MEADPVDEEVKRRNKRAMIRFSLPPIYLLIVLLAYTFIFGHFVGRSYIMAMPIILFIAGVFIAFIGAFWDFGEKEYISSLIDSKVKITDADLDFIRRQQFFMTLIYFGIMGLYILAAIIVNLS